MYVERLQRGIVSPCVRPFLLVWPWPPLQLSAFRPAVWDVLGVFHLRHPTVLGPVRKKISEFEQNSLHNFHQWTVNNFIPNIYNFLISAFNFFVTNTELIVLFIYSFEQKTFTWVETTLLTLAISGSCFGFSAFNSLIFALTWSRLSIRWSNWSRNLF